MSKPNITGIITAAKTSERERIIKLLEGLVAERKGTTPSYALLEAIALIKGENATDFTDAALPNAQEGENK